MNRPFIKSDLLFTILILSLGTALSFLLLRLVPENNANVVLIYIFGLIIISRWTKGHRYGIFAALFCVIVVNYCFTYPYFKLNFTLSGYPVTFLEMITIALITSAATSLINQDDTFTKVERAELAAHIYDGSEWLLHMVENLLSVTRIKNNTQALKRNPEIAEEIVSESVERIRKRIPDAPIHVEIPEEMLMIPMDAMLIEQVLINLLENALTHAHNARPIDLIINRDNDFVFFMLSITASALMRRKSQSC